MTGVMGRLANGELEAEVPARNRRDEIGSMARAVQVFKENAIGAKQLRDEQARRDEAAQQEKREETLTLADDWKRASRVSWTMLPVQPMKCG